jgi:adenosine deaminase
LTRELSQRAITLDLCPTSNVQAAIFPDYSAFPLARLHRAGVPVTLSTDDRTVSDLTLVREYSRSHAELGLSAAELWAMNMHALRVAFLHHDEALRASLIEEFEAFAGATPELGSA